MLVAGTVFYLGQMVGYVALPFQIYDLTGSNFAVGAMGIVQLVPLIVFGLYGGALADHVDRRTMLVVTGAAQVVLTAALLVNAMLDQPQVWAIYVIGALLAVASALQRPSRDALLPRIVRHDELPAAVALSSLSMQIGMLLGPAIGGVVWARSASHGRTAIDVVGLALATIVVRGPASLPTEPRADRPSLAAISAGLRYALGRRDLLGTYVVDMVGMFMAMPLVLFPAFATEVLRATAGARLALLRRGRRHHARDAHERLDGPRAPPRPRDRAGGDAGAPRSGWPGWRRTCGSRCLLALAGGADMISGIFRSVVWNQTIPDEMRGRLAGIEMLSYSIGPLGGRRAPASSPT